MNIKYLKDKINESACVTIDDYASVTSENIIENYMIDSIVGHMIDVINMDGNYDKFLLECYGIEINYESLYNDCCFINEADNQQPEGKLKGHFKKHWKKYAAGAAVAGAAGGAYMAHKKGLFKGDSSLKDANHLNKGPEKTDLHNRNVPLSAMKPHERAEALKSTKAAAETRKAAAEKAKGDYRNDKSYGDTFKDSPKDNKATRAFHGAKSWLKDKFKKK